VTNDKCRTLCDKCMNERTNGRTDEERREMKGQLASVRCPKSFIKT